MSRRSRRPAPPSLALVVASLASGCGDATGPAPPALVSVVSDVPALAAPGIVLEEPLTIRVEGADGEPLAGARVAWSNSGPGELRDAGTSTDGEGLASAWFVPGQPPGWERTTDTVTARVGGEAGIRAEIPVDVSPAWFEVEVVGAGTPADLSDAGHVVFTARAGGVPRAALWVDGRTELLGLGGADSSGAAGVNGRGEVVGWVAGAGMGAEPRAATWSDGVPRVLAADTFALTRAVDIDDSGRAYGHVGGGSGSRAAIWSADGSLELPFEGTSRRGIITAASASGTYGGQGSGFAFVVVEGDTLIVEGDFRVLDVNDEGTAVGVDQGPMYPAPLVLGPGEDRITVGYPGRWATLSAIADDEVVVGRAETNPPEAEVRLWPPSTDASLSLERALGGDWRLRYVVAVDSEHRILASASRPGEEDDLVVLLRPVAWPE